MSDELAEHAEVLRCEECGAVSADGRGWQAHLIVGPEHAEHEEEAAVFWPDSSSASSASSRRTRQPYCRL